MSVPIGNGSGDLDFKQVTNLFDDTWKHCLQVQSLLKAASSSDVYRACMQAVGHDCAEGRSGTRTQMECELGARSANLVEFRLLYARTDGSIGPQYDFSCTHCSHTSHVFGGLDVCRNQKSLTMHCADCHDLVDVVLMRTATSAARSQIGGTEFYPDCVCIACGSQQLSYWDRYRGCPKCGQAMKNMGISSSVSLVRGSNDD